MLDRRSQSPMATSQKMGTARAIFDAPAEQEPMKRLTRSVRNTSQEPYSTEQKSFQYQAQPGVYLPQDTNSPNSRQFTQENFEYRKPETETINFRTAQTYKPQEINAQPTTQFDYANFEYKKPDAGSSGSYIQPGILSNYHSVQYYMYIYISIIQVQEPLTSTLNYQTKSTYEPPKYENTYGKYEVNTFDKYKTTFEQPKTYEKFEQYKFEPTKFEPSKFDFKVPEQPKDYPPSYRSIPQAQKNSIIQTSFQAQERVPSEAQINRATTFNQPFENTRPTNYNLPLDIQVPRKTEEPMRPSEIPIRASEIYTTNQNPIEITTKQVQYPPSQKAESLKKDLAINRPTAPVYSQQQQSSVKPLEQQQNYDPVQITYKPSYKGINYNTMIVTDYSSKYAEEIVIVENEANEPEFNAGCNIF